MHRPTGGFSMVEVLVAVLLLAVGLVGALAMQAHAMRTRQESALQTEALQAAADLADHIRANAAQSSAYLGFELDGAQRPPATTGACIGTPCDAATLARRELDEFAQHLLTALPSGRAVICRDSVAHAGGLPQWECTHSPEAPIIIKIGWRSREQNPSPTPQLVLTVTPAPASPAPPTAPPVPPAAARPSGGMP